MVALVAAACASSPAPSPRPPAFFALPAAPVQAACRGIGLEARLTGNPSDPRIAWLEPGGRRLVWPFGFVARFSPTLEILDQDGRLVMREGDAVSGACLKGTANEPSSVLMIEGLLTPRGSV